MLMRMWKNWITQTCGSFFKKKLNMSNHKTQHLHFWDLSQKLKLNIHTKTCT